MTGVKFMFKLSIKKRGLLFDQIPIAIARIYKVAMRILCGLGIAFAIGDAANACASDHQLADAGTVTSIGDRFEINLHNGRTLLPSSLSLFQVANPGPKFAKIARQYLQANAIGRKAMTASATLAPDRWGRIPSTITIDGPSGLWDVTERMLEDGLARYSPGISHEGCRARYLAAEGRARAAALGLWEDPYYAVVKADRAGDFASRSGEFLIVEGRVWSVSQTAARFYVQFGPLRGVDFALTVSKHSSKTFERVGMRLGSLLGKRLRVRGLLDTRFGPQILVSHSDAIERIER